MRKFLRYTFFTVFLLVAFSAVASALEPGHFAPLSPEYLRWLEEQENDSLIPNDKSGYDDNPTGYVPFPVDLSHLAANPPRFEEDSFIPNDKAGTTETKYDLRNVSGKSYVTSIKNQNPYETCWAFASIGAMESNYMMQGNSEIDLSEMHLAYFTFKNADKSKAFYNLNGSNFDTVMKKGGNMFYPTALYSRLEGPVSEAELPYTEGAEPTKSTPDAYNRVLRLRDVYYLSMTDESKISLNTSDATREVIKQRIKENGAVAASYYSQKTGYYQTTSGGTAYYYTGGGTTTNHAVQIIGWDDNYSASNFKTKPASNGAWLIKNSWGSKWSNGSTNVGDDGYFWMSYEQYMSGGAAFVVEEINESMKAYYYDALGWSSTYGWTGSEVYSANVFRAERDNESLIEVGFYTTDNNMPYEISIYPNIGTSMPSSSPIPSGITPTTISATMPCAGYHTVSLAKPLSLTKGQYFSIVVKLTGTGMAPLERKGGFAPNAVTDTGSFFSPDGSYWETGKEMGGNACIKAFTVDGENKTKPVILTNSLPAAVSGQQYTASISASGSRPITWTASATIPSGLGLSSLGVISGNTSDKGTHKFTVTARNDYGTATKEYELEVVDKPVLSTTSFSGYAGYAFNGTLQLSQAITAEWKTNGKLPSGLKLDKATGKISGKPSKAGTYTVSVTATTSAGDTTDTVTFTIEAKPVKPTISTSSLKDGVISEDFSQEIKVKGTEPITYTVEGLPDGLTFNENTLTVSGTPKVSGKFTIKLTAENIATQLENKPVTKNIKLTIKAQPPVIADPGTLADAFVGKEYSPVTFTASQGDGITWTASGLPSGLKLSKAGVLTGTPKGSPKTYNVTLKASNTGGKDTRKVELNVLMEPQITTKKLSAATTDKKYSAKLAAKGGTPMTWTVTGLPEGLAFTEGKNGTSGTIAGTTAEPGKYTVAITVKNTAGNASVSFDLEVKGVAPKLTASLAKGKAGEAYTGSKISATGTKPITLGYTISDKDKAKFGIESLEDLGLTFTANTSEGTATITGTSEKSVKSLPITITASSDYATKLVTKKVSLTITGTKPSFTTPSDATVNVDATAGEAITVINLAVNGTPDITFTMSKAAGFTLTSSGNTAQLSGTPSKKGKTTITVTAANADGKATKKIVIDAAAAVVAAKKDSALPEVLADKAGATEGAYVPEPGVYGALSGAGPAVKLGAVRTVNSLGEEERSLLESEGYTIVAVLPEVEAEESDLYDFDVTLDDEAETGAKLYWFAFPQNAESSEDDEIAEFYDIDGAEIECVPEERDISISVWLNEGVKYAPVIAVKSGE